jgi:peptidoglycan/LPS O-acetylase OafA/YrhL
VSYGLYVIHGALSPWFRSHVVHAPQRTAALLVVSIALAAVSARWFERPFMRLKSRWPMPAAQVIPSATVR